jgi:hypothetical protein
MEITERGCVYFFRHIGLSPVKIGYSTNESPINRFESFKTYAPYGAELLGFIMTKESKELESILHQRFSAKRLKGEWFEVSKEDVDKVVSFYSNLEDIKEKNEFEIAWLKKIANKNLIFLEDEFELSSFSNFFSIEHTQEKTEKVILNKGEIIDILKINKNKFKKIEEFFNLKIKSHRISGKVKGGYCLYKSVVL